MSRPENRTQFWDALIPLTLHDAGAFSVEDVRRVLGMTEAECARVEDLLNDGVANPRHDDISAGEFASDIVHSWFASITAQVYSEEAADASSVRLPPLRCLQTACNHDLRVLSELSREELVHMIRKYISLVRQYRDLKFID